MTDRLLATFDALAARPRRATALVSVLALCVCLAGAAASGMPRPTVHDEFSYLLAADTFAHGRITNPTHPMWRHFDTMHVLHRPTYQSMYPPAQGLVLALGQLLGHPAIGIWIAAAAMVAACMWMAYAWLPPRWALTAGILIVSKLLILGQAAPYLTIGYWSRTYWGGALAACGGALVYGALRRIVERPALGASVWMVAGLALLATTRPFEGFMLSLPAAITMIVWISRQRGDALRIAAARVVLPTVFGLAIVVAGIGYYNYRVTGDPLKMPWVLHHEQYAVFPILLFQERRPEPEYSHETLREFHTGWELDLSERYDSMRALLRFTLEKAQRLWRFYLGPLLTLPLLMLPLLLTDGWMRLALAACITTGLAHAITVVVFPHYAAPAVALVFVLIAAGLRRMCDLRVSGRPAGAVVATLIVAATFAGMLVHLPDSARRPTALARLYERARVVADLERSGGKHLVIVRYAAPHAIHEEWVFNGADLDGAAVLLARDMGPQGNRELLDYYADRKKWLLIVSDEIAHPEPAPYLGP